MYNLFSHMYKSLCMRITCLSVFFSQKSALLVHNSLMLAKVQGLGVLFKIENVDD